MSDQFNVISIAKNANVHFNGASISHMLKFKDVSKKTLGVILPSQHPLVFKTHLAKRIEITSDQCRVLIGNMLELKKSIAQENLLKFRPIVNSASFLMKWLIMFVI